jgi:hypothetical protein
METFGKHKTAWKVIMIIAALSLVAASFLPYLTL